MKRRNYTRSIIILFIIIVIILITTAIVLNIVAQNEDSWLNILNNLVNELLSVIVIGLLGGATIKIITDKLLFTQANMKQLREMGIDRVSTSNLKNIDIDRLFGKENINKRFPQEIKMMFFTGKNFLKKYSSKIVKCLNEGTVIKLLIVSAEEENHEYLNRISKLHYNGIQDIQQEVKDTLETIKQIKNCTSNPNKLHVRFYLDEYQNNIRISKYITQTNNIITYGWINLQPINKSANDLSLTFSGKLDSDKTSEKINNIQILYFFDEGFNNLWDIYEDSELKDSELLSL